MGSLTCPAPISHSDVEARRANVVRIAREWIGTPYRLRACVKQGGADCATFVAGVLQEAGEWPDVIAQIPQYSHDWWASQPDQRYLAMLRRFATEIFSGSLYRSSEITPGSVVCARQAHGKMFWHGGIVLEWPRLAHCVYEGVGEVDATRHWLWAAHIVNVFNPIRERE